MKIGIIDADLIGKNKHRFPNLACMKISAYYKNRGEEVSLLLDYKDVGKFDKVFISKVFTDVEVPADVLKLPNVQYGGTGFYFDKAPALPKEIEHIMPDYHLYDDWVREMDLLGKSKGDLEHFKNYSIGFTTRGCIRGCNFCVNKNFRKVELHSPLKEFVKEDRKYICLLDDNVLASPRWREVLQSLAETKKPFKYMQGMDIRVLTEEKAEVLSKAKYKGEFVFAFDKLADKQLIIDKLTLWRKYCKRGTKLYVLGGFDDTGEYSEYFYVQDIKSMFERIKILMKFGCIPYVTRFEKYKESKYRGMYITLARWCNQPSLFKKKSFREFCEMTGEHRAPYLYMQEFEEHFPHIAKEYFDLKFMELNEMGA